MKVDPSFLWSSLLSKGRDQEHRGGSKLTWTFTIVLAKSKGHEVHLVALAFPSKLTNEGELCLLPPMMSCYELEAGLPSSST